jgi:PHD/YefM family antitoxin component YafN of YafNO toxin-antitoxin module
MTANAGGIPYIDPNVEHVGVSKLRTLNATNLSKFRKTFVIQDNDTPLAVLLNYEQFLIIQSKLQSLLNTIDLLMRKEDAQAVRSGLEDLEAGRARPLREILGEKKGQES